MAKLTKKAGESKTRSAMERAMARHQALHEVRTKAADEEHKLFIEMRFALKACDRFAYAFKPNPVADDGRHRSPELDREWAEKLAELATKWKLAAKRLGTLLPRVSVESGGVPATVWRESLNGATTAVVEQLLADAHQRFGVQFTGTMLNFVGCLRDALEAGYEAAAALARARGQGAHGALYPQVVGDVSGPERGGATTNFGTKLATANSDATPPGPRERAEPVTPQVASRSKRGGSKRRRAQGDRARERLRSAKRGEIATLASKLTDKQIDVLKALKGLNALRRADCSSKSAIAEFYSRERDPRLLADTCAELVRLGLVSSKPGARGGYWLTDSGQRVLAHTDE